MSESCPRCRGEFTRLVQVPSGEYVCWGCVTRAEQGRMPHPPWEQRLWGLQPPVLEV